MDMRRLIAAGIIAGSAAAMGCRADPYAEVREREWRRLENEIYSLEGVVEDLEGQLDSCRRENDALRKRGGSDDAGSGERLPTPSGRNTPRGPGPNVGPDDPDAFEDLRPPKADLGEESAPPPLDRGSAMPRRGVSLAGLNRANRPAIGRARTRDDRLHFAKATPNLLPPTNRAEEIGPALPPEVVSAESATTDTTMSEPVVAIKLLPRLTGGNDVDHRFGDEGIMAVVEARDAAGELVSNPGAMTLTLYDPMASGDSGIVAQWEFTAAEVAQRHRAGFMGSGVHFELPWPNRPPRRPTLRLEVRCQAASGKSLVASHKFTIDLCEPPISSKNAPVRRTAAVAESDESVLPAWSPSR